MVIACGHRRPIENFLSGWMRPAGAGRRHHTPDQGRRRPRDRHTGPTLMVSAPTSGRRVQPAEDQDRGVILSSTAGVGAGARAETLGAASGGEATEAAVTGAAL